MPSLEKSVKWAGNNLTGLLAFLAGLLLLGITYKIILNLLLFSVGIVLVYLGLVKLRVTPVVNFIDKVIRKIKSFLMN